MKRCTWSPDGDALMCGYHDNEYGQRLSSDTKLFEKLCLECFQAGLSWRTILKKREDFRRCFFGFDINRVADMTRQDVEILMNDSRIVRNRRKIKAVIENAKLQKRLFGEKGDFVKYVYSYKSGNALSLNLKKKGYTFVGPIICESFLMSVGAIEGHETTCFLYKGDT